MIILGDILGDPVVGILLSLPRAQVQSLVGELRSHTPTHRDPEVAESGGTVPVERATDPRD